MSGQDGGDKGAGLRKGIDGPTLLRPVGKNREGKRRKAFGLVIEEEKKENGSWALLLGKWANNSVPCQRVRSRDGPASKKKIPATRSHSSPPLLIPFPSWGK
jgi:hypothetical protein